MPLPGDCLRSVAREHGEDPRDTTLRTPEVGKVGCFVSDAYEADGFVASARSGMLLRVSSEALAG